MDLDSFGGIDPLGQFPLLYKKCADIIAPKLTAMFRSLMRKGSFPLDWRSAHITPIPKGSLSSSPTDYQPISITPVISKVFEKLISSRLSKYLESSGAEFTTVSKSCLRQHFERILSKSTY